ncbi:hypothetical protein [Acinetobacter baumannii]|jgi:hypothetical protein|uniref:hypothetical protein n=1 Tax=Acinetobacter baumannii TaxID=470 RepID=UPI00331AEFA3
MSLEKRELISKVYRIFSSYEWISFGVQSENLFSISFYGRPRYNFSFSILLGEVYPSKLKEFLISNKINYQKHILVCEYLPVSSQEFLQETRINYIDSYGNTFINTDSFLFHKESVLKPKKSLSSIKSLFSPKASQILTTMLCNLNRHFQVQELSNEALVSIGLTSKIKNLLIENKLAKESHVGEFFLTAPQELLSIWKEHYKEPKLSKKSYYCSYFGSELEQKLIEFFTSEKRLNKYEKIALCSTSAAYRVAPYLRSKTIEMYANSIGVEQAIKFFDLTEVKNGGNFNLLSTDEEQVFFKPYQTDSGIICTNLVQLVLDLSTLNDRAIEASEYIERKLYAS